MTPLTTPNETLVRIPFSGLTDFQPLALAPGLPMLDVNKLTYQVLLGWFGDLLAEPELDDDGVVFHVQHNGQRQLIVGRELATREDLDGSLQSDFERLKKSLFDVRPVSPSERLIFNRLQPPIGNHDGFLYRVETEGGDEKLVWCWGFQRRTQYGDARLCANADCSMLFLHDELAESVCPHCGISLAPSAGDDQRSRSRSSVVKASVAALVVLSGSAIWLGSHFSSVSADTELNDTLDKTVSAGSETPDSVEQTVPYEESESTVQQLPSRDPVSLPGPTETSVARSTEITAPDAADRNEEGVVGEPPELLVPFNNLASANPPDDDASGSSGDDVESDSGTSFPAIVSLPDLPGVSQPLNVEVGPLSSAQSLPAIESDVDTPSEPDVTSNLPEVLPEPKIAEKKESIADSDSVASPLIDLPELKPDPEPLARPVAVDSRINELAEPVTLTDPLETLTIEKRKAPAQESPENAGPEPLVWHQNYLDAYTEAAQQKRYLLMFFQEASVDSDSAVSTESVFAPGMRPMLEQFIRVELPLDATVPSTDADFIEEQGDTSDLLLNHRSFRHLGVQPGLAIVDLTDPASSDHARVVSAVPLPKEGAFGDLDLKLVLELPKGSISQRTLLYMIRRAVPDSSMSMREFSPVLIELAHRNCRYMAHAERLGSFDESFREAQVIRSFGPDSDLKQLLFATESKATIHDAAIQAVESWLQVSDSFDVLKKPAKAMGMDMFQADESGRWYVTCFIVR